MIHTRHPVRRLVLATASVCYAVLPATASAAALRVRHSHPEDGLATVWDEPCAQLALAADVFSHLNGYPRLAVDATTLGLCGLAATGGGFNRVGTELVHRLGATPDVTVMGPLVLHAAPDDTGRVGSLSDAQLRLLLGFVAAINTTIHGRHVLAA